MTLWHPGSPVPENWTELDLAGTWGPFPDFGLGPTTPRMFKDPSGIVTVQIGAQIDYDGEEWWTYAGFSPGAPVTILPEGYRPDSWLGPLPGIATDMAGATIVEPAFLLPDGKLLFPSMAGGVYQKFGVSFNFRAA